MVFLYPFHDYKLNEITANLINKKTLWVYYNRIKEVYSNQIVMYISYCFNISENLSEINTTDDFTLINHVCLKFSSL